MVDVLKGGCCVLAGTCLGALLGAGTFLLAESAVPMLTQPRVTHLIASKVHCALAPLPITPARRESRERICNRG